MEKGGEETSSADSAVDLKDISPLTLTSLSPRTPRSPELLSDSETRAPLAEPEDDRPQHGLVKMRVNDVSTIKCHILCYHGYCLVVTMVTVLLSICFFQS